jgi:hypothetical protein
MTPPILGIFASAVTGGVSVGSFESIATVTVGSGGSSSVSFTSIPNTYTHLQIRGIGQSASADYYVRYQFNGDSGTNYYHHSLTGDGSSASAAAGSNSDGSFAGPQMGYNTGSVRGVHICDILDYANTNKYKTCRVLGGYDNNGSGVVTLHSGLWKSTSAITSISIFPYAGNLTQYTHFALYGIKAVA